MHIHETSHCQDIKMVENVTVGGNPETFEATAMKVIVAQKCSEDNQKVSDINTEK